MTGFIEQSAILTLQQVLLRLKESGGTTDAKEIWKGDDLVECVCYLLSVLKSACANYL